MPNIERTALVPHAPEDIYAIIMDLERYPEFLPWCETASIQERSPEFVVASLGIAAKGIRETFTTRNRATPYTEIVLELVSGPFKQFAGLWRLESLGDGGETLGCRVTLSLDFEFSGPLRLLSRPFAGRLGGVADKILDAFCQRASERLPR